jgi:hypothetical protein
MRLEKLSKMSRENTFIFLLEAQRCTKFTVKFTEPLLLQVLQRQPLFLITNAYTAVDTQQCTSSQCGFSKFTLELTSIVNFTVPHLFQVFHRQSSPLVTNAYTQVAATTAHARLQ